MKRFVTLFTVWLLAPSDGATRDRQACLSPKLLPWPGHISLVGTSNRVADADAGQFKVTA
jgi:hypothetical protein